MNLDDALEELDSYGATHDWDQPKLELAKNYLYEVISGREGNVPDDLDETAASEVSRIAHKHILAD
ncbi:MAG: hypothetical protein JWM52_182 [Candidatus Saccharibacteria bacterium]|nr:hypothetical protein [Candidatus Saccharibacteria bacterium]